MKKTLIFIFALLSPLQIYALTAYEGSYDLYAKTKMGTLKIGVASLVLEVNGFTTKTCLKFSKAYFVIS